MKNFINNCIPGSKKVFKFKDLMERNVLCIVILIILLSHKNYIMCLLSGSSVNMKTPFLICFSLVIIMYNLLYFVWYKEDEDKQ
jgi:hypothetical protein